MPNQNEISIKDRLKNIRKSCILKYPRGGERAAALREQRADLISCTSNTDLIDLSAQFPTNEDIKNLAIALKENTTVTTLNLANNPELTKNDIETLLNTLEKNTTLKVIHFEGSSISEKDQLYLQNKLDQKFSAKTPGLFQRILETRLNIFKISDQAKAKSQEVLKPATPPAKAPAPPVLEKPIETKKTQADLLQELEQKPKGPHL